MAKKIDKTSEENVRKTDVDCAIIEVLSAVAREPLSYFSEADLQQLLAERIRKIGWISVQKITSVQKGANSNTNYSTSLLHREYGMSMGRRCDIVIFHKDDVKGIDDRNLTKNGNYLIPEFAIEIGTEKIGSVNIEGHLLDDIDKLSRSRVGYAIQIWVDRTLSQSGTKKRIRTEAGPIQEFKQAIEKAVQETMERKIHVIGILVRMPRSGPGRFLGKCEIYRPVDKDSHKWSWPKINISASKKEIEGAVKSILEDKNE